MARSPRKDRVQGVRRALCARMSPPERRTNTHPAWERSHGCPVTGEGPQRPQLPRGLLQINAPWGTAGPSPDGHGLPHGTQYGKAVGNLVSKAKLKLTEDPASPHHCVQRDVRSRATREGTPQGQELATTRAAGSGAEACAPHSGRARQPHGAEKPEAETMRPRTVGTEPHAERSSTRRLEPGGPRGLPRVADGSGGALCPHRCGVHFEKSLDYT